MTSKKQLEHDYTYTPKVTLLSRLFLVEDFWSHVAESASSVSLFLVFKRGEAKVTKDQFELLV